MEERKFSEQELVRREKLAFLEERGIDPFGQRFDITHFSSEIKEQYAGKTHEELEEMAVPCKVPTQTEDPGSDSSTDIGPHNYVDGLTQCHHAGVYETNDHYRCCGR